MPDPKHDSNDTAQSGLGTLPAHLVESARSGDGTAFARIIEYAQGGNTEAFVFLMERCQVYGDLTACAFIRGRLQRNDPAVLASLVERAQQGDHIAFASLYEHYSPEIYKYLAHHTGNPETGRDLMQETFLKVFLSIPQSRPDTKAKFRPWLYKIAQNILRDHYAKQQRLQEQSLEITTDEDEVVVLPEAQEKLSTKDSPEEIIAGMEHIRLALDEVGPKNRAALLKQAFQAGSQRDMAASLDINEGTFSGYVSRGRTEFGDAYQRISCEQELEKGDNK